MAKNSKKKKAVCAASKHEDDINDYLPKTLSYMTAYKKITPKTKFMQSTIFDSGSNKGEKKYIKDSLIKSQNNFIYWLPAISDEYTSNEMLIYCFSEIERYIQSAYCYTYEVKVQNKKVKKAYDKANKLDVINAYSAKLGSILDMYPEVFDSERYEERTKELTLINYFERCVFTEAFICNAIALKLFFDKKGMLDADKEVSYNEALKISFQMGDYFNLPGYSTVSSTLWYAMEQELNEKVRINKKYFLESMVAYLNDKKEVEATIYSAIDAAIANHIHHKCLESNESCESNYAYKRIVNMIFQDEQATIAFIMDVYRYFRNYCFDNVSKMIFTNYFEIKNSKNKADADKIVAYEKEIKSLANEAASYKARYEELKAANDKLVAETDKRVFTEVKSAINKQMSDNYQLKKELKSSREEIEKLKKAVEEKASEATTTEEKEVENTDFNLSSYLKIKDLKIVFVRNKKYDGLSLCREISKLYPNAKFTDNIASDIDPKTTDIVILMTRYLEHGSYWGARNNAKAKNVPVMHCHSTNLNVISKTILEGIDNNNI